MKTIDYKKIRLDKINVGKRLREGVGNLDAMAASLKQFNGPIQPIVVFEEGKFLQLVAGYRRFRAAQKNGESTIEARVVKLDREDEAVEAEEAENDCREPFSESDRVRIMEDQKERIGKRGKGTELSEELKEEFPGLAEGEKTIDVLAKVNGFGNRTTALQAKKVVDNGVPALVKLMDEKKVSISDAAFAAEQTAEKQLKAIAALEAKEAKTLRGAIKGGKWKGTGRKKKPKPQVYAPDVPKGVQNALADTWHLECAQALSKMRTEAKKAFAWSGWLDAGVVEALKVAEDFFLTAAPKKLCPECKGQKQIDGEGCKRCRTCGYLASQVVKD